MALALASTVALTGVAVAGDTYADLNDASVVGSVKPSKLPKKTMKPINLFLGVENSTESTGNPNGNPKTELISISKNVKINLKNTPKCTAPITAGSTTASARAACPKKSYIGKGEAVVYGPGAFCDPPQADPCEGDRPVVSVFHGPEQNQLILHTYGEVLGESSPIVAGDIVKSPEPGYGNALSVVSPDTAFLKIIEFNATIFKDSGVAKAKCDPKTIKFLRQTGYADNSTDEDLLKQPCKVA